MEYINGVTFAAFAGKGTFQSKQTYESLDKLIKRTNANYIVLVPNGLMETPQSQEIDYRSSATFSDKELRKAIDYIHEKGLKVALKPTVNCKNGTWRAYISFFDIDVPCEAKWSVWFDAYTDFECHYASIAEEMGCEMFITGCEMVQTEHREKEWRQLISEVRKVYTGPVTYNTDKYQEDRVTWWDALDYICSSGYYPINDWENQLDRIEKVVKKYNKPFFFAEAGCRSISGAAQLPNDWNMSGEVNVEEQVRWYKAMFAAVKRRDFVKGLFLWDWQHILYSAKEADLDTGYGIYAKPAEEVVRDFYSR